jgi:hypothetical protein
MPWTISSSLINVPRPAEPGTRRLIVLSGRDTKTSHSCGIQPDKAEIVLPLSILPAESGNSF